MQMAELLYDGVRLPMIKGSRSTDADTLDMLPANPVVAKVKEYRRSAKIYSTYVKCLYDFDLDPQGKPGDNLHSDGYIHSTYLLHGSVTGRLASRNINVQNIPREADIRSQFVVKEGRRYIELDLNQAELRCLAELSRCPDLGAIYLDEKHPGLHHEMSVFLFGEGYTDEDKMRTKAVNFGIVYGRTAPSLAEEFKTPVDEAQRWIDGWFKRFPGAAKFITSCRNAPLEGRILITPFGRKRRFGVVSWENKTAVQNEASNFPHQSIASDCNLEAAERIYNTFAKDYDARPCNLVHDSNLWDMPDDDDICAEFGYRVIQTMESVPKEYGLTTIPFKADGKMGYRWGHLNKVKASFWKMKTLAAA
jgi:DNA polymerase-1